jgi:hypothetical protein
MPRVSGIFGLGFIAALTLATADRASAQQISACVNKSSGGIRIVAPNATCSNNETLLVLNGISSAADYQCVLHQATDATGLLFFRPSQGGVSFGSAISTTGTPPFSSFTLQPGKYQLHLSGNNFLNSSGGLMTINAVLNDTPPPVATWNSVGFAVNIGDHFDIAGGDRLISVAQVNTALQFFMSGTTLDGRVRASSSSPNCNERGASARPMPFSISVLSPQLTARLPN